MSPPAPAHAELRSAIRNARQRLQVACAGIVTELIVAIWATVAWSLLPEGAARSALFFLATASWVATLAINASPFMRFDGYFILSDALDMPNLHERCFALARWKLREWLFNLKEPQPEVPPASQARWMMVFAWITWVYRLVLFLGIAVLVYQYFFKALGVFLFAVEIVWFVWRPFHMEFKAWAQRWPVIRSRGRSAFSLLILLMLIGATLLPWPGRITVSGLLRPVEVWPVYAPSGARLEQLFFREGDHVDSGQTLLTMHVPDLEVRRQALTSRIDQLRWQAESSGMDPETRKQMQVLQENLATALAELGTIRTELVNYAPKAPFSGRLHDMDPDLHAGQWLSRKERVAVLIKDGSPWIVETWVEEDVVHRIAPGDRAVFVTDSASGPAVALTLESVDRDATRVLARHELSAPLGGHVVVRERAGQLIPERAIFRVTLKVNDDEALRTLQHQTWRGIVTLHGTSEAPALRYLRQAGAVMVREFGF